MMRARDWLLVLVWLVFTLGFLSALGGSYYWLFLFIALAVVATLSLTAEVAARVLAVIDCRRSGHCSGSTNIG